MGMVNDHSLFALVPGLVRMDRSPKNRKRNIVHVVPEVHPPSIPASTATTKAGGSSIG